MRSQISDIILEFAGKAGELPRNISVSESQPSEQEARMSTVLQSCFLSHSACSTHIRYSKRNSPLLYPVTTHNYPADTVDAFACGKLYATVTCRF